MKPIRTGTLDHDTLGDMVIEALGRMLGVQQGAATLTWNIQDGQVSCRYEIFDEADTSETIECVRAYLDGRDVDVSTMEKARDLIGDVLRHVYETTGKFQPETVTDAVLSLTDAGTLYGKPDVT